MSATHTYRPGDPVIGVGVGRLTSVDSKLLVAQLQEGPVSIDANHTDGVLRPIVDAEVAQRLVARLCERVAEERTLPSLRSLRELARAPLERQVEYARLYFRKKTALHPTESDRIAVAVEHVVAELAMALGVDDGDLRASIKKGKVVVERRTVRALPPPPTVANAEHLRSFWLSTKAIVGEWPEQDVDVLNVAVRAGAWHAYLYDDGRNDDGVEGLLLFHSGTAQRDLGGIDRDIGSVNLEGGTIGVLDAAALTDEAFGVDEVEQLRRDGNGFGDRGVETSTLGDGAHRVLVDNLDAASRILLPFG